MQRIGASFLAFILLLMWPLQSSASYEAPKQARDYGQLILLDVKHVLLSPLQWNEKDWKRFSLYMGGAGTILLLDDEISDIIQSNKSDATGNIATVVQEFGSYPSFGIMGTFYLGGVIFNNYKAKSVAMDAFAASIVSAGIITSSLKAVTGRSRPGDNEGTYEFQPFGGKHSFPSGHTTQAFSIASVIAEHYDNWWIDLASYSIACGVGLARIEQEAHFPSDVAAGALIGTIVGKSIVRYNKTFHDNITIGPATDIDGAGLSVTIAF